jgi:hypothetical protein
LKSLGEFTSAPPKGPEILQNPCYFPCCQGIEKPRLIHAAAERTPMSDAPDPDIAAQRLRALARQA